MKVVRFVFNTFGENTYLIYDPATLECALVDPGMMNPREEQKLSSFISRNNLKPVHLINTHLHIDHVIGNAWVADNYKLPLEAHKDDEFLGLRVIEQAEMFGMNCSARNCNVEIPLSDGDEIKIGEGSLKIIHVPGHSPGSIALYDEADAFILTGDALFAGSIGRTDLPGGDFNTLIYSIKNNILNLPDNVVVYPGHGQPSTVGNEKMYNPYLRG